MKTLRRQMNLKNCSNASILSHFSFTKSTLATLASAISVGSLLAQGTSDNIKWNVLVLMTDMEKDPYETNNLAYDPKYVDIVITENNACNTFLAKFNIESLELTAEMLKGKKKVELVKPQGENVKAKKDKTK